MLKAIAAGWVFVPRRLWGGVAPVWLVWAPSVVHCWPFRGGGSGVVSVGCFGVGVSVVFRVVFVHCTFGSVLAAGWPPFFFGGGGGKGGWLPARLAICSHCILSVFNIYLFPVFVFKSGICLLIAPVPVHCFCITFVNLQKIFNYSSTRFIQVTADVYFKSHIPTTLSIKIHFYILVYILNEHSFTLHSGSYLYTSWPHVPK